MRILPALRSILLFPLRWAKTRSRYSKEEALRIGRHFGIEAEIGTALNCGYSPDEALQDWDIYPYTAKQYNEWMK